MKNKWIPLSEMEPPLMIPVFLCVRGEVTVGSRFCNALGESTYWAAPFFVVRNTESIDKRHFTHWRGIDVPKAPT